jgi:hypothetical protein
MLPVASLCSDTVLCWKLTLVCLMMIQLPLEVGLLPISREWLAVYRHALWDPFSEPLMR